MWIQALTGGPLNNAVTPVRTSGAANGFCMISRREFLKAAILGCTGIALSTGSESKNSDQRVLVNIPAYKLYLINDNEKYEFDIAVGKKDHRRRPTPVGKGVISEKRERIVFVYDQDIPQLDERKGRKIIWTHTFDSNGKTVKYKIPYEKMRGLAMEIREGDQIVKDFVIHSTTDEYTIGGPASDGCIRLKIKDMLKLYDLVAPDVTNGKLRQPVPLDVEYRLVEIGDDQIFLHANLYNRNVSYRKELERLNAGPDINYERFEIVSKKAEQEFQKVLHRIRSLLRMDWPKGYVSPNLHKQLHRSYEIKEFLRN